MARNDETIAQVRAETLADRRLIVREIADEVNISILPNDSHWRSCHDTVPIRKEIPTVYHSRLLLVSWPWWHFPILRSLSEAKREKIWRRWHKRNERDNETQQTLIERLLAMFAEVWVHVTKE